MTSARTLNTLDAITDIEQRTEYAEELEEQRAVDALARCPRCGALKTSGNVCLSCLTYLGVTNV